MIIPVSELSQETLNAILEDFITREGTDYGDMELSLSEKVERLKPQLTSGDVVVYFDQQLEQIMLINKRDLPA